MSVALDLDDVANEIADSAIARCETVADAASSLLCACFYVLHDTMGLDRAIECLGEMVKGVSERFQN